MQGKHKGLITVGAVLVVVGVGWHLYSKKKG